MGSLGQETQETSGQPTLDLKQSSAPSARRCRRPRHRSLLLSEARDDLTPIPAHSKLSGCRPKPGHQSSSSQRFRREGDRPRDGGGLSQQAPLHHRAGGPPPAKAGKE